MTQPLEDQLKQAYYYTEAGEWRGPEVDEWDRWHAVAKVAASVAESATVEPVQEPVLWQYRWLNPASQQDQPKSMLAWQPVEIEIVGQTLEQRLNDLRGYSYQGQPCYEVRPLYAAPQQRKPLTDEQIASLSAWDDYLGGCITLLDFARAVEAAHGIVEAP